uniref:Alpha-conotoxin-like n=1 Tax=Conus tribblei TaxID=101761 RepID=A0A0K8TUN2_CONTD
MRCLAFLVVTLLLVTAMTTAARLGPASDGWDAADDDEASDPIVLAVRGGCCSRPPCRANHPELCG